MAPHLSLLARLYAGVDNTSCEAERIFSTVLSHTVDTLRRSLSEKRIKQMMYLRLNAGYIGEVKNYRVSLKTEKAANFALSKRAVQRKFDEAKIRAESFSPVEVVDIT